jgi:putative two-component system response regulator
MQIVPPCRVVVAEDDAATLQLVCRFLQLGGFHPLPACDGEEAYRLVRREHPSMLVTDWEMPGLDGVSLCRRLRQDLPERNLFVLMITVHTGAHVLDALEAGADDIMEKPLCQGELLARLRCGLKVVQLRNELEEARRSANRSLEALAARAAEIAATRDVAVFALAKLAESRDPETGEHLERLRSYSQILAEELRSHGPYQEQVDDHFLEDLYRSSPLHDIGKVGIPDAILRKPGRLTPSEFEVMKQHTTIGAEALEQAMRLTGCGGFLAMAVDIARYHHERFDGTGYPCGLRGLAIPLPARIVALADVYDALTSVRVYKEAYPAEQARSMILEQEGQHFDPAVVAAFRARFADFLDVRSATASSQPAQALAALSA